MAKSYSHVHETLIDRSVIVLGRTSCSWVAQLARQPFAQLQPGAKQAHFHIGFAKPQRIRRLFTDIPSTSRSKNTTR